MFDVVFSQVSRSMQITNNPRLRVGDVDFYADTLLQYTRSMNQEPEEILDLNHSHFFNVPDNDRYVDFFFTDHRDAVASLEGNEDELFQDKLFPIETPKTEERTNIFNTFSTKDQERKLQTKKKMKNTYASKIAKLIHDEMSQPESVKVEEDEEDMNDLNCSGDHMEGSEMGEDRKQEKLLKNRLSAQKSRKMKKEYMEILEDKVNELQEQLDSERKTNEKNAEKLRRYTYHEAMLNGYFISRDQMFEKMEEALKTKTPEQELNILLDSLRFRFGGTGKERVNLIRYYYEQIFDLMIPDLSKYTIYSAVKSIGLFSPKKDVTPFCKVLEADAEKESQIKKLRQELVQSRQTIVSIAGEFACVKEQLQDEVRKIEGIFDKMRTILNTEAEIRCVLFLQKNKYKPEYSAAWRDWKSIFTEKLDQSASHPRKLMKVET